MKYLGIALKILGPIVGAITFIGVFGLGVQDIIQFARDDFEQTPLLIWGLVKMFFSGVVGVTILYIFIIAGIMATDQAES